jgi:hypothetical protein
MIYNIIIVNHIGDGDSDGYGESIINHESIIIEVLIHFIIILSELNLDYIEFN